MFYFAHNTQKSRQSSEFRNHLYKSPQTKYKRKTYICTTITHNIKPERYIIVIMYDTTTERLDLETFERYGHDSCRFFTLKFNSLAFFLFQFA